MSRLYPIFSEFPIFLIISRSRIFTDIGLTCEKIGKRKRCSVTITFVILLEVTCQNFRWKLVKTAWRSRPTLFSASGPIQLVQLWSMITEDLGFWPVYLTSPVPTDTAIISCCCCCSQMNSLTKESVVTHLFVCLFVCLFFFSCFSLPICLLCSCFLFDCFFQFP